jgi:hypothetical protein
MKKTILLGFSLLLTATSAVWAADAKNGETLYDKNCMRCHDKTIHTRPDSIIHSLEALKSRVSFCDMAAQAHFTPEQQADVTEYLNQSFYKFPKP